MSAIEEMGITEQAEGTTAADDILEEATTEDTVEEGNALSEILGDEESSPDDDSSGEQEEGDDADAVAEDTGEEAEPAAEPLSTDVLFRAFQTGLNTADLEGLDSNSALKLIEFAERQKPGEQDAESDEQKQEWFDLTFENEDDLAPEIVGPMRQMNDFYKEQVSGAMNTINELSNRLAQVNDELYNDRFETSLSAIGDDWSDQLGEGGWDEISPEQRDARVRLDKTMATLRDQAYMRKENPSMLKLMKDAVPITFKDKVKSQTLKAASRAAKKRTKSEPPNNSLHVEEESEDDKMARALREGLKERGIKW